MPTTLRLPGLLLSICFAALCPLNSEASPIGDTVDFGASVSNNLLFEDGGAGNPGPINSPGVTVVTPGAEFGFQIDDQITVGNGGSGISVSVNLEDTFVQLTFFGSTIQQGTFQVVISDIDWLNDPSGILADIQPDPGNGTGIVGASITGPHEITIDGETFNAVGGVTHQFNFTTTDATAPVPEPGSLAVWSAVLTVGFVARRRRRRTAAA